jgi:hypothetical protein
MEKGRGGDDDGNGKDDDDTDVNKSEWQEHLVLMYQTSWSLSTNQSN